MTKETTQTKPAMTHNKVREPYRIDGEKEEYGKMHILANLASLEPCIFDKVAITNEDINAYGSKNRGRKNKEK